MSEKNPPRIGAIILAAGAARRMGRPKALLPLEGRTFIEVLIDRFCRAGVGPILAVLGTDTDTIRQTVKLSTVRVVQNPDPARGQLASIHCGLDALAPGEADAVFIAPVDTPRVRVDTLQRIMAAYPAHPLVVPCHRGKKGHPTLFSAALFEALRQAPLDQGARSVVYANRQRIELDTDDPTVLDDFDWPNDLKKTL